MFKDSEDFLLQRSSLYDYHVPFIIWLLDFVFDVAFYHLRIAILFYISLLQEPVLPPPNNI